MLVSTTCTIIGLIFMIVILIAIRKTYPVRCVFNDYPVLQQAYTGVVALFVLTLIVSVSFLISQITSIHHRVS